MNGRQFTRALRIALLLLCWHAPAHAHSTGISHVAVSATQPAQLQVTVSLSLHDLDAVVNLDPDDNAAITWGELRGAYHAIAHYVLANLHFAGDQPCVLTPRTLQTDTLAEGAYAVLQLDSICPAQQALHIHSDLLFDVDTAQRTLLSAGSAGTQVLSAEARDWQGSLSTPTRSRQLRQFIHEGVWHIWMGFDHLAFLMLLLLPTVLTPRQNHGAAATWRRLLGIVSMFTLAHSLTLGLAALGYVRLPTRAVEATIAASIVLTGIANLHARTRHLGLPAAGAFGLIHGFGFAAALSELGSSTIDRSVSLLGFNLGVELGQLAIVALLVPLLMLMQRHTATQRYALPVLSSVLSGLGALWLWQRLAG